jgi:hypothetical protein
MLNLTLAVVLAVTGRAATTRCPDGNGGTVGVAESQLAQAIAQARRQLVQKELHVTDLPPQAMEMRRRLEAPGGPTTTLCSRYEALQRVLAALRSVKVDQRFAAEKLTRVSDVVRRATLDAKTSERSARLLAEASAALSKRQPPLANRALNQTLALAYGKSDPWTLPPVPSAETTSTAAPRGAPLSNEEVLESCPAVVKQQQATPDDLDSLRHRLAKSMDDRHIRPLDIKDGLALVDELKSNLNLAAALPAARILCALQTRLKATEVDLGFVSHRFGVVRQRLPEGERSEQVSLLVREASDDIAGRAYKKANAALEQLLVLLGEPAQPSASLP